MKKVQIQALTHGPKQHFFGFHDVSPWNADDSLVLGMEADFLDRMPRQDEAAIIGTIDTRNGNRFEPAAKTRAWNFQQGARAQWLPGSRDTVIFNDRADGKFISVVLNVKSGGKRTLPMPVYAVSPDGTFGLGLNFARLGFYGGYGYIQTIDNEQLTINRKSKYQMLNVRGQGSINEPFPSDDGIFRIDFESGVAELIISIRAAAHLNNQPREGEQHILTHITFNPSGSRICFIDKYRLPDGGFMQRLITMNPDGTDAYVLPGHVSHFDWKNDDEILAYGKLSPKIMLLRKKGLFQNRFMRMALGIVRKMRGGLKQKIVGQSYLLFKDKTQKVERIAVGVMTEDGHPSFHPGNRDWFVTDTYPDKDHFRTLLLYNIRTGTRETIGRFYSLPDVSYRASYDWDLSEMRSDLHPRWSRKGDQVCFDSAHEGSKQMYVVTVDI